MIPDGSGDCITITDGGGTSGDNAGRVESTDSGDSIPDADGVAVSNGCSILSRDLCSKIYGLAHIFGSCLLDSDFEIQRK
jgi:hypothetical protein